LIFLSYQLAVKLFVAVKSLPKDALVEKQVLVHTGQVLVPDEDEESEKGFVLRTMSPGLQKGI